MNRKTSTSKTQKTKKNSDQAMTAGGGRKSHEGGQQATTTTGTPRRNTMDIPPRKATEDMDNDRESDE